MHQASTFSSHSHSIHNHYTAVCAFSTPFLCCSAVAFPSLLVVQQKTAFGFRVRFLFYFIISFNGMHVRMIGVQTYTTHIHASILRSSNTHSSSLLKINKYM